MLIKLSPFEQKQPSFGQMNCIRQEVDQHHGCQICSEGTLSSLLSSLDALGFVYLKGSKSSIENSKHGFNSNFVLLFSIVYLTMINFLILLGRKI